MRPKTYQIIRSNVLKRIQNHDWKPGDRIPPEADLAVEYGCARGTVNRALRDLAQAGILDRKRKAGTRVSLTPVRKATFEIPVVRLQIEQRGDRYRHRILSRDHCPAPVHIAARMNLPNSPQMLHLKTLHLANDHPHMFEDRWINIAAAPGIDTAPLDRISANEWLVQNIPISRGDIAFSAAPATADDAAALGLPQGTALFILERITWRAVAAITTTRLAYAPGYRMTTHI